MSNRGPGTGAGNGDLGVRNLGLDLQIVAKLLEIAEMVTIDSPQELINAVSNACPIRLTHLPR